MLCCSRVQPLKNISGLIEAFARVAASEPGAELRIAGAGDDVYRSECERLARALGVGERVHFLGNLGFAELQDELSRAACAALVSFQENAPLAVAEAMAAGAPVAGARVGGIPEMVEDGVSGLLVDPRRADDIARALAAVLADPARAKVMGERGRVLATGRYKAEAVGRATVRVYEEILGRRGGEA